MNNNSLPIRICLIIGLLLGSLSCQKDDDSSFWLLDGGSRSIESYKGQWVVVNFWAEWCRPCLEEVPELNLLNEQKQTLNLEILAFSYDPISNEMLRKTRDKYAIQYPLIATDPVPIVPFKKPSKLPAMILISPEGKIHPTIYGKQSMLTIVKKLEKTE